MEGDESNENGEWKWERRESDRMGETWGKEGGRWVALLESKWP